MKDTISTSIAITALAMTFPLAGVFAKDSCSSLNANCSNANDKSCCAGLSCQVSPTSGNFKCLTDPTPVVPEFSLITGAIALTASFGAVGLYLKNR